MAFYTRPVFWAVLTSVAAVAAFWSDGDAPHGKTSPRKRSSKSADAGWDFPASNPALRFAKPHRPARDPFAPLARADHAPILAPKEREDLVQIPSSLAGGEGGWAYTGMAEVDGVRMALLENAGTSQSGYVREGEEWKGTRVAGITMACIVLADAKGLTQSVFRFNPDDTPKPKPEPVGGFRPLDLTGRIGDVQIRPLPTRSNLAQPPTGVRR